MQNLVKTFLILIAFNMPLFACSTYRPLEPAFHDALKQAYTLDAGDVLRITVFNQENLTNSYKVNKAGFIAFPLIGDVLARGKTAKGIEHDVSTKLRQNFLRNPDISVEVSTYRPFYIMGEVSAGGQYSYVPGMTAQHAIATAGGFTARAQHTDVDITRNIDGKITTGRVLISDPVLPGDTIFIRERLF